MQLNYQTNLSRRQFSCQQFHLGARVCQIQAIHVCVFATSGMAGDGNDACSQVRKMEQSRIAFQF